MGVWASSMQGDDLVLPPAIVLLVAWLPAELNWGSAELNWGSAESNWGSAESHWIAEVVAREVRHGVGIASILGEKRPILCVTEKKPKTSIPILVWGLPESVWVGICQYSKSGSPHSAMGFIPIWGPTYMAMMRWYPFRWPHGSKMPIINPHWM